MSSLIVETAEGIQLRHSLAGAGSRLAAGLLDGVLVAAAFLSLLIGADILAEKESWYRFDEIQRLVDVLVLGRGGFPPVEGVPVLPEVSSSEIRRRLAGRLDVSGMVPDEVLQYIGYHSLYFDPTAGES